MIPSTFSTLAGIGAFIVAVSAAIWPAWGDEAAVRRRIAIDVGHSKATPGAISARGVGEFYFNQTMAKTLSEQLQKAGFETVLINGKGDIAGLRERTAAAVKAKADLFLSVHHDSCHDQFKTPWIVNGKTQFYADQFSGYSVFFSGRNPHGDASFSFASHVGSAVLEQGFHPTDHHAADVEGERRELRIPETGVYHFPDLVVLHSALMPAILFECGVIVNREEELRLLDPSVQLNLATGIVNGIQRFFRGDGVPISPAATAPKQSGKPVNAVPTGGEGGSVSPVSPGSPRGEPIVVPVP